MKLSQLQTIDIVRPGIGKRYSMLPVDHVDVTGFHASYHGSPLQPSQLDIMEGDVVLWHTGDTYYQALVDEIVIDQDVLRAAFRDVEPIDPAWW